MRLERGGNDRAQAGTGEVVQFGRPIRPRRYRLDTLLLACLVVAAVVAVIARSGNPGGTASRPAVTVTDVGHPILGVRADWQLIGLDSQGIVAVQLAPGRIVRTTVPPLLSGGPVFFVAARGETIIRPLDNVPGYVVPDGKPAEPLTGVLAEGGVLLPGPTLTEQWFGRTSLDLLGPRGQPVNAHLAAVAMAWEPYWLMADGAGGVLLINSTSQIAQYDARPGMLRPVGTQLVAVGPTTWLGVNCERGLCQNVAISAATGASRLLPGPPLSLTPWSSALGAVAPDGRAAAVIVPAGDETGTLELVSLTSGGQTRVAVPVTGARSAQLAWAPDSTWLFVITANGDLDAVNPRTGRAQNLGLRLSGLRQIATRGL